jgi:hypothetical protein
MDFVNKENSMENQLKAIDVASLLRKIIYGNKIEAVEDLKRATGWSLNTCKATVAALRNGF